MTDNNRHIILLVVWDGLRPDTISATNTPFLHQMAQQGVLCRANHAVFPTATRINSASLTTGCTPGRHGIVDNELYIPALDAQQPTSCADWTNLQKLADLEGGRLLDPPTLGELLQAGGKKMVSIGSGSPGKTYLTDPTLTGPVINWATAWPETTKAEVEQRFGPFLSGSATATERNQFVFRVLQDYLLPTHQPDLIRIWLTEPDHAQHKYGLGSPEALAALAELDAHFATFWADLVTQYGQENLTCFFLSDHGFTTITDRVKPDQALIAARLKAGPDSNDIIRTSNSFYLNGQARSRLPEIARFLAAQPWLGGLFIRDDLLDRYPDGMPQSLIFGGHRRSAEIMFTYRWTEGENSYGVPGGAVDVLSIAATHGSASPYAINNSLIAWGKEIKQGLISQVPCGIIDLAPTILHLFGLKPPPEMQGRLLYELFQAGPPPEALAVAPYMERRVLPTVDGEREQVAWYSKVGGYWYLDRVEMG